jgi:3-dehydroquinate synthase
MLYNAAAVPARRNHVPVVELNDSNGLGEDLRDELLPKSNGPMALVIDTSLVNHKATSQIQTLFQDLGYKLVIFDIAAGEADKNIENAVSLLNRVACRLSGRTGGFVVVGGGSTLNLGSFVASISARGTLPTILVPTTIMAIADVAVGSKTAVNIGTSSNGTINQKHAIGTFHNPAAVFLLRDYIYTLPDHEIFIGFSEILKHAYAQDTARFLYLLKVIHSSPINVTVAYEQAIWALKKKSDLMLVDPWEDDAGLVLQIGHLHAHALEKATNFHTSHGYAVYWGMLLDSIICGTTLSGPDGSTTRASNYFAEVLRTQNALAVQPRCWPSIDELISAYDFDPKPYHHSNGAFQIVELSSVGEFPNPCHIPRLDLDRDILRRDIQNGLVRIGIR